MSRKIKIETPLSDADRERCDVILERSGNFFDLVITDTMRLPVLRMLRAKERQHGRKTS